MEQEKAEKKKDKAKAADNDALGLKSIQFRTWLSFVTLTAITLIILWCVQILFYTASFKQMNKSELKRAGDVLSEEAFTFNFVDKLQASAVGNGFSAVLISADTFTTYIYASANGSVSMDYLDVELFSEILDSAEFSAFTKENAGSTVFVRAVEGRGNFIIYASRVSDFSQKKYYLCLVKPMIHLDASVSVLRNQLIIVTVICMLISMLLSLTFSRKIAKPITKFSTVARALGKGDFSVRFEGNGWMEIDELADTLNYATEEMGKTEALRRDFLANVSHDLRTPLTMVRAYAEMIKDISGTDKAKREAHAQIIIDEADRLTKLVGDILDLSKLQSGTEERSESQVDICALTRTVLARFDSMSQMSGYDFSGDMDGEIKVVCDGKRIEQVLYNLISNAMNYTGEDKKVCVRVVDTGAAARVEVRDTGKGIPESERGAVWDRYYRANQTKRTAVGTGLGLSIVKNILSAHGAAYGVNSITADNNQGLPSGTTFWFELNKAPESAVSDNSQSKESE